MCKAFTSPGLRGICWALPRNYGGNCWVLGGYYPKLARPPGYFFGITPQLPGLPGNFWVLPKNYPASRVIFGRVIFGHYPTITRPPNQLWGIAPRSPGPPGIVELPGNTPAPRECVVLPRSYPGGRVSVGYYQKLPRLPGNCWVIPKNYPPPPGVFLVLPKNYPASRVICG